LQVGTFFGQDCSSYRANLQTNPTINTGGKVNPVPISPNSIFAGAFMNAGYWAGANTIGHTFTNISNDRMRHAIKAQKQV
jgi:hypothetical protein